LTMLDETLRNRALEVLLGDDLADVVDLVFLARDGEVEAHSRSGSVAFTAAGPAWVNGRDPIASQDVDAFTPLADELAGRRPSNDNNRYPYAYSSVAQLFDDPRAPDLAVVHTPSHNWEERGGHLGEHGSLDLVQSRAPLILAGAGVRKLGRIDAHARMIDIAPTIATLAGVNPHDGSLLKRQDGRVLTEVLDDRETPERVVAFLWDGTNANVLYEMAAAGELPNVARLIEEGSGTGSSPRSQVSRSPTTPLRSPASTPGTTACYTTRTTTGRTGGRSSRTRRRPGTLLATRSLRALRPSSRRSRDPVAGSPPPWTSPQIAAPVTQPSTSSGAER
jgi:hypothetical protein